jgi:tetrahydromethanopterin S-methyltransferase subunit G
MKYARTIAMGLGIGAGVIVSNTIGADEGRVTGILYGVVAAVVIGGVLVGLVSLFDRKR